jgi:hypothetical protein
MKYVQVEQIALGTRKLLKKQEQIAPGNLQITYGVDSRVLIRIHRSKSFQGFL